MIKRSSLKFINKLLEENKSWKVLDVGCGYTANKNATTLCDVLDLQNYYPDKEFVKLESKILPFKDNEFDFVIEKIKGFYSWHLIFLENLSTKYLSNKITGESDG